MNVIWLDKYKRIKLSRCIVYILFASYAKDTIDV